MSDLEKVDTSDWLENTKRFCTAAHVDNKEVIWNTIFSHEENETKDWPLHTFYNTFAGWNQVNHHEYTKQYETKFFEEIERYVKNKGRFITESMFYSMRPTNRVSPDAIARWTDLLLKVKEEQPDNNFFINLLKDTVSYLNIKQRGQDASTQYLISPKGMKFYKK